MRLVCAHMNHGLIKKEGKRHQIFSENLARRLHIPFYSKTIDVRRVASRMGRSIEEAGRIERYRFFTEVAARTRRRKIATAHTLDDQAETVLLRILRGTGLRGLAAIPAKRKEGRFQIIRPFLETRKKDILSFLKQNTIGFCADKTNKNPDFARNRVRGWLIPQIEKHFDRNIQESLAQLAESSALAADYLEKEAKLRSSRGTKISIKELLKMHPALQRETIFQSLLKAKGDLKKISHSHILSILAMASSPTKHGLLHLPDIKVQKINTVLNFKTT